MRLPSNNNGFLISWYIILIFLRSANFSLFFDLEITVISKFKSKLIFIISISLPPGIKANNKKNIGINILVKAVFSKPLLVFEVFLPDIIK